MEKDYLDLNTLLCSLRDVIEEQFPDRVWIKAEVASVSVKGGGHCYLELTQARDGAVIARARAVIWRGRFTMLSAYLREATGGPIEAGMTILARVQVEYSELYGLTLVIDDLDADVTLGELERVRRETIARLSEEGLLDLQRERELPLLPYRLAVVSAPGAAGYGDFCRHLTDNAYGFKFEVTLFEAVMQGASAPESISDALDTVQTAEEPYDAVLILRGGGSVLDLACFDDYTLCCNIARFPLPVFTAIGHDRDNHVADMVAYESVKTPTALADSFIEAYMAEDERISSFGSRLRAAFASRLAQMESRVEALRDRIHAADPRNVLRRGYTLAADAQGHVLKSAAALRAGDLVRVLFTDGEAVLTVNDVKYGSKI